MDLLPVDLLPAIWHVAGPAVGLPDYMRIVPTADLSVTMGLSLGVLILCLFYNVKIKGLGGWTHELFTAPFGNKWFLYPVNFLMQIIEFVAKTVSHACGCSATCTLAELIFMLIALMGGAWALTAPALPSSSATSWPARCGPSPHPIITLQAFVFMMLTLVYLGQAHDAH